MRRLSYLVDDATDNKTVESVLHHQLHLTKHAISHAKFEPNGITVDNHRAVSTDHVHAGQTVSAVVGDSKRALENSRVMPMTGPLHIVYEDADIVVVDKQPGLAMHPGPGHHDDTLGNFLRAHFAQEGIQAGFHPVHRLDKGTSGLVVIATNAHAQERLQKTLHTPDFKRSYLAFCMGKLAMEEGCINEPIGLKAGTLNTYEVRFDGKPACTRYASPSMHACDVERPHADRRGSISLVQLELETGRTHQIRVHMAFIGHPLLGDRVYGVPSLLIDRPALHSTHLEIVHPVTEKHLVFDAPLPEDMRRI